MPTGSFRNLLLSCLITAVTVTALWWGVALVRPRKLDTVAERDPLAASMESTPEPGKTVGLTPDELVNIRVYKAVSPGVVNIVGKTVEYDFFFQPLQREGSGSGFVIDNDGNIVTNYHVVRESEQVEVSLLNEPKPFPARVVGADPINDLAVIRISAPRVKLRPVKMGDSSRLQVGQKVLAIGNPFRLQGTLTGGVISALDRTLVTEARTTVYNVIQTDAAINSGNSGGPLLNTAGEMIGVNTMIFSPSGGSIGIGFAIPANTVKRVANDLIAYGEVRRPWLGVVKGLDLKPELAEALGLTVGNGVLVTQVEEGSPAQEAGIRGGTQRRRLAGWVIPVGGDIIAAFDGKKIDSYNEIRRYLEEHKPGEVVKLTVVRDGRRIEVPVRLAPPASARRWRF
ncbi:MAG: trypsin-like peptidase domain-containing protein [Acidobacteria bacterium]|nr:trypsin-like peptidase domain-containing protein [Acidobacteriota bacterium]MBI3658524.1 trypsin-like peptidase domain-containing protein [Acidobacteriota bacterium]